MRKTLLVVFALMVSPVAMADVVVLKGATIIDGTGRAPQQNGVLVLDGERILAVGAPAKVKGPRRARRGSPRPARAGPGVPPDDAHGSRGGRAGDGGAQAGLREDLGRRRVREVPEDGARRVQGGHRSRSRRRNQGRLARLLPRRCEGGDRERRGCARTQRPGSAG